MPHLVPSDDDLGGHEYENWESNEEKMRHQDVLIQNRLMTIGLIILIIAGVAAGCAVYLVTKNSQAGSIVFVSVPLAGIGTMFLLQSIIHGLKRQ